MPRGVTKIWNMGVLIKSSKVDLRFPATGSHTGALGYISHLGIHDQATGDLIARVPRVGGAAYVDEGDAITFAAGSILLGFSSVENDLLT